MAGSPALTAALSLSLLNAQVASYYRRLHHQVFPLVQDTTHRSWLPQLRTSMQNLRKVEWHDRFFREVATLYLEAPDEPPALIDSLCRETGIAGSGLRQLWNSLSDTEALPDFLLASWKGLQLPPDSMLEAAILLDLIALGESAIEVWLPTGVRPAPLVEATWTGYLKALWAAYQFMGFRDSPESWQKKHSIITAVGLLEYYAYAEAANRYRAWRRGYWH